MGLAAVLIAAAVYPRIQVRRWEQQLVTTPDAIESLSIIHQILRANNPHADAVLVRHSHRVDHAVFAQEHRMVLFDANLEAALQPPTIVIDGDITVQTTRERPPLNPKNFDYEILWEETPFRYDSADGVNLLIDKYVRGGYSAPSNLDTANIGVFRTSQPQNYLMLFR